MWVCSEEDRAGQADETTQGTCLKHVLCSSMFVVVFNNGQPTIKPHKHSGHDELNSLQMNLDNSNPTLQKNRVPHAEVLHQ